MHSMPQALQDFLTEGGAPCRCIRITRKDGAMLYMCDSRRDVVFNGDIYRAAPSEAAERETAAAGDTGEAVYRAPFCDDLIARDDVEKGLYDNAGTEIFLVNPGAPEEGGALIYSGYLGEIRYDGEMFSADIRHIADLRNRKIVSRYSPYCRAAFGDTACGFDKEAAAHQAALTQDISAGEALVLSAMPAPGAYFAYGTYIFTSGANEGYSGRIAFIDGDGVHLADIPPLAVSAGDNVTLYQGCDKRFVTCSERYDNAVNFRGEPHLPGAAKLL